MDKCFLCKGNVSFPKKYKGKSWHKKCLRKVRKKAKRKYFGNLDKAIQEIKKV